MAIIDGRSCVKAQATEKAANRLAKLSMMLRKENTRLR